MSLDVIADRAAALFGRCFGHPPSWLVAAPGRVNLIGEHTDYNEGFVLPMAINHHVVIAGRPNKRGQVTLHSTSTGETASFKMRPRVTRGEPAWSNYVRGVVAAFQERHPKLPAFDALIESTLPYGGGLASSAALEVAVATLLETMVGTPLDPLEKAVLCQRAETDFAGVPCGIMDQFTSILGRENHALLLDCRSRTATPVPMTNPEVTVLIINTNVRHRLAQSEYPKRRSECQAAALALKVPALRDATLEALEAAGSRLEPIVFRRSRHVITENARTLEMARAIQASDWPTVGKLMYASHASLRDDYEVSCKELDTVVGIAQEIGLEGGMIGCRMTGGGFGGCAVSLVKTEFLKRITRAMDAAFEKKTGRQASIFSSRPAAGACVLKSS
jgi:galactokinase